MTQSFQFSGNTNENLFLSDVDKSNTNILKEKKENDLTLIWFTNPGNTMLIDGIKYSFSENQILCITEFHKIEVIEVSQFKMVRFNKPFYCILDHDSKVGCKGVLFFGAANLPIINLPEKEVEKFKLLWQMFTLEFQSKDELQLEMLQMMLKRLLILSTRLFNEQSIKEVETPVKSELIREFNYLVESHFKSKHSVSEYAELLFKSPKTLANYFSKHYDKSPIQIIQGRLLIEARRLLIYSEMSISDVAYELGFDNIQAFSRFFKSKQGTSPTEYRYSQSKGTIAKQGGIIA